MYKIQGGRLFNEMFLEMLLIDSNILIIEHTCNKYNIEISERNNLLRLVKAGEIDLAHTILSGLVIHKKRRRKQIENLLLKQRLFNSKFKRKRRPWRFTDFQ